MNDTLFYFTVTSLSGLFTMLGCLLLYIKVKNVNKFISKCLIFSSIIMLLISFFDLIPASFSYISKIYEFIPSIAIISVFGLFGGILVHMIDKKEASCNNLYKLGIISMIALILHNIPEGMITFLTTSKNTSLGISLSLSIALHNIPEGMIISIPIYYGEGSRKKACFYTLIAALSEPFGALISYLFLYNINNFLFAVLLSMTAGIMIYLSIYEIKYYKEKKMY